MPAPTPGALREELLQTIVKLQREQYEEFAGHLRAELASAQADDDPVTFAELRRLSGAPAGIAQAALSTAQSVFSRYARGSKEARLGMLRFALGQSREDRSADTLVIHGVHSAQVEQETVFTDAAEHAR